MAGYIYTVGNAIYESSTLLLAISFYRSYQLHISSLIASVVFVVWNAGTWYVDRFPLALADAVAKVAAAEAESAASRKKAKAR